MGAGKGDFPRNLGPQFKDNYSKINWTGCAVCGKGLCDHQE